MSHQPQNYSTQDTQDTTFLSLNAASAAGAAIRVGGVTAEQAPPAAAVAEAEALGVHAEAEALQSADAPDGRAPAGVQVRASHGCWNP